MGIKGYCQLLEDKTNVYFGYQNGFYLGNELFNSNGTISPSFYSNLKSNNGLTIKYLTNQTPNLGLGFKLGFLTSTNWQSSNYISYNGSSSSSIKLQPVFQMHTKSNKNGLYNCMKLYGEISPVFEFSMISIRNNLFDIIETEKKYNTFSINNLFYGLEVGVGCEYAFTNKIGAYIDMSMQEGFINAPLFLDSNFTLLGFNIGVRINLSKVKRFNY